MMEIRNLSIQLNSSGMKTLYNVYQRRSSSDTKSKWLIHCFNIGPGCQHYFITGKDHVSSHGYNNIFIVHYSILYCNWTTIHFKGSTPNYRLYRRNKVWVIIGRRGKASKVKNFKSIENTRSWGCLLPNIVWFIRNLLLPSFWMEAQISTIDIRLSWEAFIISKIDLQIRAQPYKYDFL